MSDGNGVLPLVSAHELSRSFIQGGRSIDALKAATCASQPRARTAIMGSSGSGKSTLLHLIAGIDCPTAGDISWPALGTRDGLRPGKITIAFQTPSLVPFLSVAENVALPMFLLGKSGAARQAAMDALAHLGLAELADKPPDELSGGQAQRVALARAMASRPQLLLADEPTAQLDQATAQATMLALVVWAEATGSGLIVTTHDENIASCFDRIWRMEHGRLVAADKTP